MSSQVVFSPEAEDQLVALYHYIAAAASPDIAVLYTDALISYCESLSVLPNRGTLRNDIRPGLRITNYRKRTVIAFAADSERVSVIGVFHGGRDYEAILSIDLEETEPENLVAGSTSS